MKLKAILPLLLIASSSHMNGQINFQRSYGTVNGDFGTAVVPTYDGGYIMTGKYDSSPIGIIKTDNYGNVSWIKTLEFPGATTTSIIETLDSNYVIAGSINQSLLVFKINNTGDTIWIKSYGGGPNPIVAQDIVEDMNGNLILAASEEVLTDVCCWPLIYKLNPLGDLIWFKYYDCPTSAGCRFDDILIDDEGNYLVTGMTPYPTTPIARLTKTDTDGNEIWNKYYYQWDIVSYCLTQATDGDYLISGGYVNSDSVPLIRTDKNGAIETIHSYYGDTRIWECSSIDTTNGGYYLSGFTFHYTTDFFLIKINDDMDMLWSQTYGGNETDFCSGMESTDDGGSVMIGYTNSFGAGNNDYYLIKTDQNGIAVSEKERVIQTKNIVVYPNPFSVWTKVKFDRYQENLSYAISDCLGQVIERKEGLSILPCFRLSIRRDYL